ncbi:hypothetical protein SDC9_172999 [bioreactor metagenome]|uniref:Uncharacterized protein n=1 Tax=bioreactor metagenome TaxID=1076179 RepID=A0A645GF97_9ZZZZ
MPGLTDFFVDRLIRSPVGIAGNDIPNAVDSLEVFLHAPETASGQIERPISRFLLHGGGGSGGCGRTRSGTSAHQGTEENRYNLLYFLDRFHGSHLSAQTEK